ncbi:MAG: FKBP-type peptidyl-prolyl cis-trans isomerase [Bacteroidales bacterium]|nr:FKBP-type peptidyl-prolyl cis-trans isomerase [Bacteroidales bacterium]
MKSKRLIFRFGLLILATVAITSCSLDKKLAEAEEDLIREYIRENNVTVSPTASGLYYIETVEGAGVQPVANDTCGLYFTVWFLNGIKLGEMLEGEPFQFELGQNQVIKGFEEGVSMMKQGGKARLIIPSSLAYGKSGDGYYVPGYTPLLYEMELVYVIPGPAR